MRTASKSGNIFLLTDGVIYDTIKQDVRYPRLHHRGRENPLHRLAEKAGSNSDEPYPRGHRPLTGW